MSANQFSRWIKKTLGLKKKHAKRQVFRHTLKPWLEALEDRVAPAVYTVNALTDTGAGAGLFGDLRYCLNQSNSDTGPDTIQFNVGGGGAQSIALTSALPAITNAVTIDATTQPGFAGTPLIELNGANAGSGANGLTIMVGNTTVRGLVIDQFGQNGILFSGGGNDILTLRDSTIQEPTGDSQAAISITGGIVDLGTASDPGNNTLNISGNATFISNSTTNAVSDVGDTFQVTGITAALWTGAGSDNLWSDPANWQGDTAPNPGDVLVFDGANATPGYTNNDFPDDTFFAGIVLNGSEGQYSWVLQGNEVALSGDNAIVVERGLAQGGSDDLIELPIQLAGDATFRGDPQVISLLQLYGAIDTNGYTLQLGSGQRESSDVRGTISGAGGVVIYSGNLLGANDYAGPTTVPSGGIVSMMPTGSSITVNDGANLDLLGGQTYAGPIQLAGRLFADGGTTLSGDITLTGSQQTIAPLGPDTSNDFEITGTIQGGTLDSDLYLGAANGATLVLSGTTNYAGPISIGGITEIDGSLTTQDSNSVYVTGTLQGTGTINAPVSTSAHGNIAPGNGPGVLTTQAIYLASGSSLSVAVDGDTAGAQYSQLDVARDVYLYDPTLKVSLGYTPAQGTSFTVINNEGGHPINGTFAGLPEGSTLTVDGVTFAITYHGGDGNDVVLTVVPVAQNDAYATPVNTPLRVSAGAGVLSNDWTANGSYPLTPQLVNGPSYGTLTLENDGSFTYTPLPGFVGMDQFTYLDIDSNNRTSNVATVTITVNPGPHDDIWTGPSSALLGAQWTNGSNWLSGQAPSPGDSLIFTGTPEQMINDFPAGTAFASLTFILQPNPVQIQAWRLLGQQIAIGGQDAVQMVAPVTATTGYLPVVSLPALSLTAPATLQADSSTLALPGDVETNGFDLILDTENSASYITIRGSIHGSGGVEYTGPGISTIGFGSGNNDYTGTTTITDGSQLVPTSPDAFGATSGATIIEDGGFVLANNLTNLAPEPITINQSGTFYLRNDAEYDGPIQLAGTLEGLETVTAFPITVIGPNATIQVYTTSTLADSIGEASPGLGLSLMSSYFPSPNIVFDGTNTYMGLTRLSRVGLEVNSTLAGQGIQAAVHSAVSGTGTVVGSVTLSDSSLAPGTSSPGILTVGGVSLDPQSQFAVALNNATAGTGYDQLAVNGDVDLGGSTLQVSLGYTPAPGTSFMIINNEGADPVAGTFAGLPEGSTFTANSTTFSITYKGGDGNDVVLTADGQPDTTTLASSSPTSVSGQSVTFTATVSPIGSGSATPTGTVQFQVDGGNYGSPIALSGGTASFSTTALAAGNHTITANYSGDSTFNPSSDSLTQTVAAVTSTNLQTVVLAAASSATPIAIQANTATDANTVVAAVDNLPATPANPVSIELDLGNANYSDLNASPPTGVTLVIVGNGSTTTIVGQSPALTVTSGNVSISNVTFTTDTDAPTILVTGGSLTLRNDTIEESTGYSDAAISVTGGTADLGTAADPGNNILNINGQGRFVQDTTTNAVPRVGDSFEINGLPVNVFTVLTAADSGPGSLRQAILDANAAPNNAAGPDIIKFAIGGEGVQSIAPTSPLPVITDPVTIDGWSQPGFAGSPLIEINGSLAGFCDGFNITAGNTTLRGLVINRFAAMGVEMLTQGGDVLEGCYIGTDVTGTVSMPNGFDGVHVASSSNRIGTDGDGVNDAVEGNLISGNHLLGVEVTTAAGNVIAGNKIGTDVTGTQALANGSGGIRLDGAAHDNRIGASGAESDNVGERNLISGNNQNFVAGIIVDSGCSNNVVGGNFIGTDVTGTKSLPNSGGGIDTSGDHTFIGTNAAGVAMTATRNVVSGNSFAGIILRLNFNVLAGNFIGTDPTGTLANGNSGNGVDLFGAQYSRIGTNGDGVNDAAEGNVISGNTNADVWVAAADASSVSSFNVIAGNLIGTDVSGFHALDENFAGIGFVSGAHDNRIGVNGADVGQAAERNVISGHKNFGIYSDGAGANTISGNLVGTDVSALLPLGNGQGIAIWNGGGTQVQNNVISANGDLGIWISGAAATSNVMTGNLIGTDITGSAPLRNGGSGVLINNGASNNLIGGTAAGARNIIAANAGPGVTIGDSGTNNNQVVGNSIHDNGGLGIDLSNGANHNQAAPVLTAVANPPAGLTVSGSVPGATGTYLVQFFANPSGAGEGQTLVGSVTTDTAGNFTASLPALPGGQSFLSATATVANADGSFGDTSPFSQDLPVPSASAGGPYTLPEGSRLTLDASGSSDPAGGALTYSWDVNGDGVFGDATGVSPTLTWSQLVALGYSDAGETFNVSVEVTNAQGGSAISPPTTLTVNDAPPTSVQIVNPSITSAGSVGFSVAVSGPTAADEQAGYGYTINWGDGTTLTPDTTTVAPSLSTGTGALVLPAHTYNQGIYTVTLTAAEDGGLSKSTTALVVVSATAADSISLSGGSSLGQVVATTTDEGSFTTTTPPDQVLVAGQGGNDTYTVNFGSTLTTPITIAGAGSDTITVNGSTDPNTSNYIAKNTGSLSTITWGPSAGPAVETVNYSGVQATNIFGGQGPNFITDPGKQTTIFSGPRANTITITATTGNGVVINGGAGTNSYIVDLGSIAGPVTIQNNNSAATNNLVVNGAAGNNTITAAGNQVTSGAQTITNTAALTNLTVNGGSGNNQVTVSSFSVPVQNLALNGGGGSNTFTLVNVGSTVGSLAVTGGSGGPGSTQVQVQGNLPAQVTVPANTAPVVNLGTSAAVNVFNAFTRSAAFVATDSAFTATVDYGDGSGVHSLALNADKSFSLNHVYAAVGSYTVTVRVVDGQGDVGTGTMTVAVTLLSNSIYVVNAQATSGALTIAGSANIKLPGTLVVDSSSTSAILASGNAKITAAGGVQVVGGVSKSGNANVTKTGTPGATGDPLASLAAPTPPSYTGTPIAETLSGNSTATIGQGLYSQITVSGNAKLTLNPGVYVIGTGGVSISGNATLSGSGVTYIVKGGGFAVTGNAGMNGSNALIVNGGSNYPNPPISGETFGGVTLSGNGSFSLSAAASGAYAGILIYQSRDNTRALSISGNSMAGITGTIYAANALLTMSGNASLQNSLVVGTLNLSGNVALTQLTQGSDGAGDSVSIAETLLAGSLDIYIDDPTGYFSADMLARIQDAITGIDALLVPFNVTITEVSDPAVANVILENGSTSASGDMAAGVLGCFNPTGSQIEITMIRGWNWYAGADPAQIGVRQYDFQTTVTHELGHSLGLGGSSSPTSPMNELLPMGTARRTMKVADLNIPEPPDGADPLTVAPRLSIGIAYPAMIHPLARPAGLTMTLALTSEEPPAYISSLVTPGLFPVASNPLSLSARQIAPMRVADDTESWLGLADVWGGFRDQRARPIPAPEQTSPDAIPLIFENSLDIFRAERPDHGVEAIAQQSCSRNTAVLDQVFAQMADDMDDVADLSD